MNGAIIDFLPNYPRAEEVPGAGQDTMAAADQEEGNVKNAAEAISKSMPAEEICC